MTVALSVFYPWVASACPMVPDPLMDDAIRRATREFATQTEAIVQDVTIAMIASTSDYVPTLTSETEVISVKSIKRSATVTLVATTQVKIDNQDTQTGPPTAYAVLETNPLSLRMFPTPTAVENLTAKFHVMPTSTATVVDDKFSVWYLEGVIAYAKYWLMSQAGHPWSSDSAAAFEYGRFHTKVSETVIKLNQGKAGISTHVEMRPFA